MNKENFANSLSALKPDINKFIELGLTDEEAKEFVSSYYCIAKTPKSRSKYYNDVVLDLIDNYDCSKVVIGLVRFLKDVIETDAYFQFGNVDSDLLVVDKTDNAVKVLDELNYHHVIWDCAKNSSSFLDALLTCAAFFTDNLNGECTPLQKATSIEKCVYLAGGEEYLPFYEVLLD
jgi:hypothetical protein